ncbi:DeoR/GlpR family DNA-binding transcription regulator, partial [Streptococcus pyogenes]
MAKITEENYVSLEDLMQLLNSSESTIRRDLGELEQEGRLHRVHGGAELFHSLQEELSNQEKSVKNSHIKKAIAQRASQLIYDNDVIFIDAGTTTEFLLPFLQAKNLTVVTNSIHHAARLVELSIETIIVG